MFYVQNTITRPFANGKYRIAVFWDQHRKGVNGLHVKWLNLLGSLANPVRISGLENADSYLTRHYMIGTTFHELGHASHWTQGPYNMIAADKAVVESYACAVEFYFLREVYTNSDPDRYRPDYFKEYTGIGEALLNNGFTMQDLQDLLSNVAIKTLQIYVHMLFQCGKRMIGSSITCLTILIIYGISILPQNLYAQRMMNIQLISVFR